MGPGDSTYQDQRSEEIRTIVAELDAGRIPVELTEDIHPSARTIFPKRVSDTASGRCAVCAEALSQWQKTFCARHWDWIVIDFVNAVPIVDYYKELADAFEARFKMLHIDIEQVQDSVLSSGHSICEQCGQLAPFVETLRNHRGSALARHAVCEDHIGLSDGS